MIDNKINTGIVKTKLGNFHIIINNKHITRIYPTIEKETTMNTSIINLVKYEMNMFLEGKIKKFSIKVSPSGTPFEIKVWKRIQSIKYAEIKTYLQLGNILSTSARAIGNACSKNTCLLIIPCHRIINSNGNSGNFIMGKKIKKKLLHMEKKK